MNIYHIALLPGDGIGKDVIGEGIKTLDVVAEVHGGFRLESKGFPWSCEYRLHHGSMMPANALRILSDFQALYFGAAGFPGVPDNVSLWEFLMPLRKGFDLWANVRPVKLLAGIPGPLRDKTAADIDMICIRENTEGEYAACGGREHMGTAHEVAIQTGIFTRLGTERIIRYAFQTAAKRNWPNGRRPKVTSGTKSNALQYSMVFWDEVFEQVAREFPGVDAEKNHVDALAARMVTNPESLDIIVASNLFADILSDLGGAIQGSLGLPPGANLNPERLHPSLFEPVHGSAPDIAGKGIANPIAAIWAGGMMLDFLGESEAAGLLMRAVETVTASRKVLTPDLGGTATTWEMGDAIRAAVRQLGR
jgi:tartrate dehydrogenase/decarboxylase/D-malate dehydrogenase